METINLTRKTLDKNPKNALKGYKECELVVSYGTYKIWWDFNAKDLVNEIDSRKLKMVVLK